MFPRRQLLTWTAVPLALNALLYLAYRDWSLWCFRWVEFGGATSLVKSLRSAASQVGDPGDFVRFSLASGLWIFGVTSALLLFWSQKPAPRYQSATPWIAGVLILCLASELAQATALLPGTADWNDVLAYSAGTTLAVLRPQAGFNIHVSMPITKPTPASIALLASALLMATGAIPG